MQSTNSDQDTATLILQQLESATKGNDHTKNTKDGKLVQALLSELRDQFITNEQKYKDQIKQLQMQLKNECANKQKTSYEHFTKGRELDRMQKLIQEKQDENVTLKSSLTDAQAKLELMEKINAHRKKYNKNIHEHFQIVEGALCAGHTLTKFIDRMTIFQKTK